MQRGRCSASAPRRAGVAVTFDHLPHPAAVVVNDAERLSQDPAFRLIGSRKVLEREAADASKNPGRSGRDQSGAGRQGGVMDFTAAGSTGQAPAPPAQDDRSPWR